MIFQNGIWDVEMGLVMQLNSVSFHVYNVNPISSLAGFIEQIWSEKEILIHPQSPL